MEKSDSQKLDPQTPFKVLDMRCLVIVLCFVVSGCYSAATELELRKRLDRKLLLDDRPTVWYWDHDVEIWRVGGQEPMRKRRW